MIGTDFIVTGGAYLSVLTKNQNSAQQLLLEKGHQKLQIWDLLLFCRWNRSDLLLPAKF